MIICGFKTTTYRKYPWNRQTSCVKHWQPLCREASVVRAEAALCRFEMQTPPCRLFILNKAFPWLFLLQTSPLSSHLFCWAHLFEPPSPATITKTLHKTNIIKGTKSHALMEKWAGVRRGSSTVLGGCLKKKKTALKAAEKCSPPLLPHLFPPFWIPQGVETLPNYCPLALRQLGRVFNNRSSQEERQRKRKKKKSPVVRRSLIHQQVPSEGLLLSRVSYLFYDHCISLHAITVLKLF